MDERRHAQSMIRLPLLPISVAIALLTLPLAAGCGGSTTSASNPATSTRHKNTKPPTTAVAITRAEPPTSAAPFSNTIVVVSCPDLSGTWTLAGYRPGAAGAVYQETFNTSNYSTSLTCDPTSSDTSQAILRLLFNTDFTKMAVSESVNGAWHTGVLAPDGTFTDLSQTGTGFASAPDDESPIFEPGASNKLTYVSPEAGTTGGTIYEISANGSGRHKIGQINPLQGGAVIRTAAGDLITTSMYLYENPAGTLQSEDVTNISPSERPTIGIGPPDYVEAKGTYYAVPRECNPSVWVDNRRLLCIGSTSTGAGPMNQIWLITPSGERATATALLPVTTNTVYDPVVSPGKTKFAFLSRQGDTVSLYVSTLTHRAIPQKVTDLPAGAYPIAWTG